MDIYRAKTLTYRKQSRGLKPSEEAKHLGEKAHSRRLHEEFWKEKAPIGPTFMGQKEKAEVEETPPQEDVEETPPSEKEE